MVKWPTSTGEGFKIYGDILGEPFLSSPRIFEKKQILWE